MARKYGGRKWAPADDFPLKRGDSDQWRAKSSGHGYTGERWDDDTGYQRGAQSMGGDEKSFLRASQNDTYENLDNARVHQRLSRLIDGQVDQPAGPLLGGGGPVSNNLEEKDRHRRYKLGKGRLRDYDDGGL